MRISTWARNLPEFGWKPTVVCKHYGYTATRENLDKDVNSHVDVQYLGPLRKKPEKEFFEQTSLKGRLKFAINHWLNEMSVPDGAIWGWRKLKPETLQKAADIQPDIVLTSSPKHSIHFLGQAVSQALKIPWVADFRDPYMCDARFRPPNYAVIRKWLHSRFESSVYRNASKIVHAIPLAARWYRKRYPIASKRIHLLPNGYPNEILEIAKESGKDSGKTNGDLKIVAAGRIDDEAVPKMKAITDQLWEAGIQTQFRHMGRIPKNVPENNERMLFRGRVPHSEALKEICEANFLLIYLGGDRSAGIGLSSKLFEYLVTGKPVIMINPTRSDRLFAKKIPWCYSFNSPRPEDVTATIKHLVKTGSQLDKTLHEAYLQEYSRKAQVEKLAGWLDEIA